MSHNENQVTQSSVGHWKDAGFHPACNGCHCGTAARHETEIQLTFCKDHFGCKAGHRQWVVGEQWGGRGKATAGSKQERCIKQEEESKRNFRANTWEMPSVIRIETVPSKY